MKSKRNNLNIEWDFLMNPFLCYFVLCNSFVCGIIFSREVIKRNYRMGLLPMPRSGGINGNFIDKTFSIVANILLRIIPTTSGEKEAFTYYRDGAIWFFFQFSLALSVLVERHGIRDRKKTIIEINLRFLEVQFENKKIPSVVYPRLM